MTEMKEYGLDHAAVVTPSDTVNLSPPARMLWIGGAGALKVDTISGETVTLSAVPAGSRIPLQVRRVYSTGTAATAIIALY